MSLITVATRRRVVGPAPGLSCALVVVGVLVAAGLWLAFLRPQALGGPSAFVIVSGDSMEPRLHAGDLVVAAREPSYSIGDVVTYRIPDGEAAAGQLVIHRIVGGGTTDGFLMRGDNAAGIDLWRPRHAEIIGRLQFAIPAGGVVITVLRDPVVPASVAAVLWLAAMTGRGGNHVAVGAARRGSTQRPLTVR